MFWTEPRTIIFALATIFLLGWLMLEALLILAMYVGYLRLLPTVAKVMVGKPVKAELLSQQSTAKLDRVVANGRFVGKALWLLILQPRAWFMVGYRSPALPMRWNLDETGSRVESIDIKVPLAPFFICLAVDIVAWQFGLVFWSLATIGILFVIATSLGNLALDKNEQLKEALAKVVDDVSTTP